MKHEDSESAPVRATVAEVERLRAEFRALVAAYVSWVDGELGAVQAKVAALGGAKDSRGDCVRDLRDMLTLLRNAQIKPGKARRKDLKKIETVAEDLKMLTDRW